MDQDTATQYVIRELSRQTARDDIILRLCEQLKCAWPDAEKFVCSVEQHSRKVIAARQSPILIFIGLCTVLGGLGLAGVGIFELAHGVLGFSMSLIVIRVYMPTPLMVLIGLAMIGGGGYGTLRAIGTLTRR